MVEKGHFMLLERCQAHLDRFFQCWRRLFAYKI